MDWQKVAETSASFSIPYLTAFTQLPIFFRNWKNIYVVVASLIAASIYACIRYTDPNFLFLSLSNWWIFIIAAFALIILYIFIFTRHGADPVNKKVPVWGLMIFVLLYASIIVSFSLLFQSFDHRLVKGKITDEQGKPVQGATVNLYFKTNDGSEVVALGGKTNANGISQRYFTKEKADKLEFFEVYHPRYININATPISSDDLIALQDITLKK